MDSAEQIRVAATQLFATLGYEGASLQAIADQVGVTKQTLLYHYPSKEALRSAVLDGVFAHWRQRLPQMLEAVTSGHRRFEALTEELIAFFQDDSDRARLLIRELLDNPREMRRLLTQNLRPWILLVAQYIREGQRSGVVQPAVDAEAYVLHTILLVLSSVAVAPLTAGLLADDANGGKPPEQRSIDELLRLTRTALFAREGSPQ
jgi:TetR/AcrR family transcriptional regulator